MKLIQTNFTYTFNGDVKKTLQRGSYIGKKVASMRTLKKFTAKNANGIKDNMISDICIVSSHISSYLNK